MNVRFNSNGVNVAGFQNLPHLGVVTSRTETGSHITGSSISETFTYDVQNSRSHSGYLKSNCVGGVNAIDQNGNPFYGAPDPTISDFSAQPHDISWGDVDAGFGNFVGNTDNLSADWQLVGHSLYLGLTNLTTNPSQAVGSLGMGIGSAACFTGKSIYWLFK